MFTYDDERPTRRIPVRAVGPAEAPAVQDDHKDSATAPPAAAEAEPDWKELALRLQAEMASFRRRQERRADEATIAERERLLRQVLPVLDNLERALDGPIEPACSGLARGVELTRRELVRFLESEGVSPIAAAEAPFTPALHEAVATITDPGRSGRVVQVVQTGYVLNDRLLRPARVVVAA